MTNSNVLQMPKIPRRATFARVTQNYAPTLAVISLEVRFQADDAPKDPEGNPMVRELASTERYHAGTAIAAQFMRGLLNYRGSMELQAGSNLSALSTFANDLRSIILEYQVRHLGKGSLVMQPAQILELTQFENTMAGAIFGALRAEMTMRTECVDEPAFWSDVFLGMSDADGTGVVGKAARMVFLDRKDEFERAWEADCAYANSHGEIRH